MRHIQGLPWLNNWNRIFSFFFTPLLGLIACNEFEPAAINQGTPFPVKLDGLALHQLRCFQPDRPRCIARICELACDSAQANQFVKRALIACFTGLFYIPMRRCYGRVADLRALWTGKLARFFDYIQAQLGGFRVNIL